MPHACMLPIVCIYIHVHCTLLYMHLIAYYTVLHMIVHCMCYGAECQLFCIVGHSLRAVLGAFVHVCVVFLLC